jgi:hypothetical protein
MPPHGRKFSKKQHKTERNKQRIDWQQNVMGLIHFVLASFLSSGFTSFTTSFMSRPRVACDRSGRSIAFRMARSRDALSRVTAIEFFLFRPHIFGVRARQIGSIPAKSTIAYFSMPATGT